MSERRVIVVGSINADLTVELPRIAQPGETVLGSGGRLAIGGKGFNQALACRRYGASTTMIAAIGNDAFGRQAIDEMAEAGIDTSATACLALAETGSAAILVTPGGVNTIAVAPGANARLRPHHVNEGLGRLSDSIVVAQLEVPIDAVAEAFMAAKREAAMTILNPAPAHENCASLFAVTDILVPNEFELADLAGISPVTSEGAIAEACRGIVAQGVGIVIATLGSRGCAIFKDDSLTLIPAFDVEAIDSSGAGDTFVGTLAASLAEGASLHDAVEHAMAASALSVMRMGAAASPNRSQVVEFLRSRKRHAPTAI